MQYPVPTVATIATDSEYGTIWSNAQINTQLDALRPGLASARIKLVIDDWKTETPVGNLFKQVDNSNPLANGSRGYFDFAGDNFSPGLIISRDHSIIRNNYKSAVNQDANDDNDLLDVYFVAPFLPFGPGNSAVGFALMPSTVSQVNIDSQYMNSAFVSLVAAVIDNDYIVTAHEVFHHLTNQGDVQNNPPPKYIFFPNSYDGNGGTTPEGNRRIQEATVQTARTQRGSMTDSGNRLLRSQ